MLLHTNLVIQTFFRETRKISTYTRNQTPDQSLKQYHCVLCARRVCLRQLSKTTNFKDVIAIVVQIVACLMTVTVGVAESLDTAVSD